PRVGPIAATALVAEVGDWKEFRSGRSLAAWIGWYRDSVRPGGKERLGGISKQGNRHLRWLLVAGCSPRTIMAQAIRPILLASATAATLIWPTIHQASAMAVIRYARQHGTKRPPGSTSRSRSCCRRRSDQQQAKSGIGEGTTT